MVNLKQVEKITKLKRIILDNGVENIEDIEPTLFTVIQDVFGLINQYDDKADEIRKAGKNHHRLSSKGDLYSYKFEQYIKLLNQMEIYIKMNDDSFSDSLNQLQYSSPDKGLSVIGLSYCWADNEFADVLDKNLQEEQIKVIRDIRDLGNWESLKDFMKSLKEREYIVLLISDSYLKSSNCMYEVLDIMKLDEYATKILSVIIDNKIYSKENQIEYISYWEEKSRELKKQIGTLEYINSLELGYELKKSVLISQSMGEFLSTVSDLKNPNPNITDIVDAIVGRVKN